MNSHIIGNLPNWYDDQCKVKSCIRSFIKTQFAIFMHDLFIILREKTHAYTNLPFLFIIYLLYCKKILRIQQFAIFMY